MEFLAENGHSARLHPGLPLGKRTRMPPASIPDRPLAGIALRLLSAACLASMAGILKAANGHGAHPIEMIFYRSLGALPVVLAWTLMGPGLAALATRRPMAHVTRCAIGVTNLAFSFTAIARLPLGEATTITYTAPVFATILSALVLREAVGAHRWIAVAIGFVGMIVVVHPMGNALAPLGVAAAIAAAIGTAAVTITLRQIGKSETTNATVFWFSLGGALVGAALLPVFGRAHDAPTYALLLSAGVIGGVGQLSLTASLRFAPVSTVVPFDYLQIIWATAIGWAIFATPPSGVTLTGAALIAGSGVYTAIRERRHGRAAVQAMPTTG